MNKFWALLEESVIVQSFITASLIGALVYLWVTGQTVPAELYAFVSLITGYWFGSKSQFLINKRAKGN